MKKAKKISTKKFVLITFIVIFLFNFLFKVFNLVINHKFSLDELILIVLYALISTLVFMLPFFAIYRTYKLADKVAHIENLDKIDFSREKEYYREVLKDYSPAELYYLLKLGKINEKIGVIATLLKLKLKKILEIRDNKIEIVNNNIDSFSYSEKYIMDHLIDGKVVLDTDGYTLFYAQKEALEDNLIELDSTKNKKIKRMIIILFSFIFIFLFFTLFLFKINNHITIILLSIFFSTLIPLTILFLIIYISEKNNSYVRTKKGQEMANKLKGLNNFLNDFGNMEEKDIRELILWEDYLIYSIIFEINDNVVQELETLVDILLERGKIYIEK